MWIKDPSEYDIQSSITTPEHEPSLLLAEHLVGRYVLDSECEAGVGDLDLVDGVGRDFMGHDNVLACERLSDEVVVADLKERADSGGRVPLPVRKCMVSCPLADRAEGSERVLVGL